SLLPRDAVSYFAWPGLNAAPGRLEAAKCLKPKRCSMDATAREKTKIQTSSDALLQKAMNRRNSLDYFQGFQPLHCGKRPVGYPTRISQPKNQLRHCFDSFAPGM